MFSIIDHFNVCLISMYSFTGELEIIRNDSNFQSE